MNVRVCKDKSAGRKHDPWRALTRMQVDEMCFLEDVEALAYAFESDGREDTLC